MLRGYKCCMHVLLQKKSLANQLIHDDIFVLQDDGPSRQYTYMSMPVRWEWRNLNERHILEYISKRIAQALFSTVLPFRTIIFSYSVCLYSGKVIYTL